MVLHGGRLVDAPHWLLIFYYADFLQLDFGMKAMFALHSCG